MKGILIIFLLLLIIILLLYYSKNEYFEQDNCTFLNKNQCKIDGLNCGWSVSNNGISKCLPGDEYGPFLNKEADNWWFKNKCIYGNECRNGDIQRMRNTNFKPRSWDNQSPDCSLNEPKYVKTFNYHGDLIHENIFIRQDNGKKGEHILSQKYKPETIYRHDGPLYTQICTS